MVNLEDWVSGKTNGGELDWSILLREGHQHLNTYVNQQLGNLQEPQKYAKLADLVLKHTDLGLDEAIISSHNFIKYIKKDNKNDLVKNLLGYEDLRGVSAGPLLQEAMYNRIVMHTHQEIETEENVKTYLEEIGVELRGIIDEVRPLKEEITKLENKLQEIDETCKPKSLMPKDTNKSDKKKRKLGYYETFNENKKLLRQLKPLEAHMITLDIIREFYSTGVHTTFNTYKESKPYESQIDALVQTYDSLFNKGKEKISQELKTRLDTQEKLIQELKERPSISGIREDDLKEIIDKLKSDPAHQGATMEDVENMAKKLRDEYITQRAGSFSLPTPTTQQNIGGPDVKVNLGVVLKKRKKKR